MRADTLIYKKGLCRSRTQARCCIENGTAFADGRPIKKPSEELCESCEIVITEKEKFVSRGGLKLEGAIEHFQVDVKGKTCLDIGASTGGFTDCLLFYGAKKVYAVDCGHSQLDDSLLGDERVVSMEGVNARYVPPSLIGAGIELAVMDVSFISQTLILPTVAELLDEGGMLISLIKPQFEAGRAMLNKKGIVTDESVRLECIKRIERSARTHGLVMKKTMQSPIKGGDGNVEYLALFVKEKENEISDHSESH